jgi:ATP-dependent DNA helicase RecQ
VDQFTHHTLSVFGIGPELGDADWRGVTRQLLAQGLLSVDEHNALGLTTGSAEVLFQGRQVRLRREPERSTSPVRRTRSKASAAVALAGLAADTFERLRAWRASTAAEQSIPAYVIFHDSVLRQIASVGPQNLAELRGISGVGEAKLTRYGPQILEILQGT